MSIITVFNLSTMTTEKYNQAIRGLEPQVRESQRGGYTMLLPARKTEVLL